MKMNEVGLHTYFVIETEALMKGVALEPEDILIRAPSVSYSNLWRSPAMHRFTTALREIVWEWAIGVMRMEACRRRAARIHEELAAAVWHPRRVARRLEEGGWDAIDAIL